MTKYRYRAVAASGETIEGTLEAADRYAAIERLQTWGHVPIRADEVGSDPLSSLLAADLFGARTMSPRALVLVTRQLAILLHAGLPLDQSLQLLAELSEQRVEKACIASLLEKISGGSTLADAMSAQPKAFPSNYVSMIRAGEAGANLEAVLDRLAEFLERSRAAREQIVSALIYPLLVLATCGASLAVIFLFVIPRFKPLFEQAGTALPTSTQLVLGASDFVQELWWTLPLACIGLALLARWQWRNPAARRRLDRWLLKIPLVGDLVAKIEIGRFARTLGTLLKNGVSLLTALAITRETIRNSVLAQAIAAVIDSAQEGKGLADPLMRTRLFPPLAVHLIRVGEETARHEEMLLKVADIFEQETQRSIQRLLSLLGPVVTIGLGLLVAGVIGSILSAMLSVYDVVM